jgi:hypothetical protein
MCRKAGDVFLAQIDLACAWGKACDRVDERCLAGAVGSDKANELAVLDGYVNGVEGDHAAVADRKSFGPQSGSHGADELRLRPDTAPAAVATIR